MRTMNLFVTMTYVTIPVENIRYRQLVWKIEMAVEDSILSDSCREVTWYLFVLHHQAVSQSCDFFFQFIFKSRCGSIVLVAGDKWLTTTWPENMDWYDIKCNINEIEAFSWKKVCHMQNLGGHLIWNRAATLSNNISTIHCGNDNSPSLRNMKLEFNDRKNCLWLLNILW